MVGLMRTLTISARQIIENFNKFSSNEKYIIREIVTSMEQARQYTYFTNIVYYIYCQCIFTLEKQKNSPGRLSPEGLHISDEQYAYYRLNHAIGEVFDNINSNVYAGGEEDKMEVKMEDNGKEEGGLVPMQDASITGLNEYNPHDILGDIYNCFVNTSDYDDDAARARRPAARSSRAAAMRVKRQRRKLDPLTGGGGNTKKHKTKKHKTKKHKTKKHKTRNRKTRNRKTRKHKKKGVKGKKKRNGEKRK